MVGAGDESGGANHFRAVLDGAMAEAVMKSINDNPDLHRRFDGKQVHVFRNGGLEINCDGFYTEGASCRGVMHRAMDDFKKSLRAAKRNAP